MSNKKIYLKTPAGEDKDYLERLPLEVQGLIVKTVYRLIIDQEARKYLSHAMLEKYVLAIPLSLGMKFSREFRDMQNILRFPIAGKKFLAQELFVEHGQERDVIIRMANHPIMASGNIMPDDYERIKKSEKENIKKGLKLKVNYKNKKLEYIGNMGVLGVGASFMGLFCSIVCSHEPAMLVSSVGMGISCAIVSLSQIGMCCINIRHIEKYFL